MTTIARGPVNIAYTAEVAAKAHAAHAAHAAARRAIAKVTKLQNRVIHRAWGLMVDFIVR